MGELDASRAEISRIDGQMARLFEERMHQVEKIAAYKREHGLPIRDPAREDALLARCRDLIRDPAVESLYVEYLRRVMDLSCRYQEGLIEGRTVAFCGVEGAYAHLAARRLFPEARCRGYGDFEAAYRAVENGECDCAVLPLENSYAGEVGTVMDLMFTGSLYINRVTDLPVRHGLLACPGAVISGIRTVCSHPQALRQCAAYIRSRGWETVECANTALAARQVREAQDLSTAAIASEEAAGLYGLVLLEGGINDTANNTTRFGVFSRSRNLPARTDMKDNAGFMLVFTVQNKAGALAQTLNIIGAHGYNMKALRSRPMKDLPWNYYFYVEAEGNISGDNGEMLLRELGAVCARLKLVGVYE